MPGTVLLEKPMSADELRDYVARQIEFAFANTPYPGDDNICKDVTGAELAEALRGRHWHEIDIVNIANHHVDMPLLTPEAFRYYVPSFMLALLFHYQHVGTLPMSLIHNLTPPDSSLLQKYIEDRSDPTNHARVGDFLSRVSVMTSKEKAAIKAFLETYEKWCPRLKGEQRLIQRAMEFWKTT